MLTILFIAGVIGILILAHEWGHFYSARRFGVRVDEFGVGFPPRLFSWVRRGVRYSLNLFPLGGFVKIFGEHGEGEGKSESFAARPAWQRLLMLSAGVGMNILAAWIFFSIAAGVGIPQIQDEAGEGVPVSVISVLPDSPADRAGIKIGDQILEFRASSPPPVSEDVQRLVQGGGQAFSLRVETEQDVRDVAEAYRGEEIVLVVRRGSEVVEIALTPRIQVPQGEGPLGIAMARLVIVQSPWYQAPFEGARMVVESVAMIGTTLGGMIVQLFRGRVESLGVAGPVGIFLYARDLKDLGFSYLLQFAALISVNLAVLNVLPIPALDGGRILFLVIEKIKGGRLNPRFENMAHTVGFALLILLMAVVTYQDIRKIF